MSLNDLDDVIVHVPLAPKEETSVTPHLSTDYITPAKSDNLHNSLNRKNFTGHSRQSSESRSLVDTPFIENGRAHEQYARSASESKCKYCNMPKYSETPEIVL